MITVGIIGSSGYVAGELLRCLINHPDVKLDFLYSHSQSGTSVSESHEDLFTGCDLVFTDKVNPDVDVVFLCLGHGNSTKFLNENAFSETTKIIDLSNDFRLNADSEWQDQEFVYGLVDLNRERIKASTHVANPGCFATAIQLGLLPLAEQKQLNYDVHINAITGSTGAGQSLSTTSHFSWRNNNISIYKPFTHQHLGEIGESLMSVQSDFNGGLNMLTTRGDFTRGIFVTMYCYCDLEEQELVDIYKEFYQDEPFTHISETTINLKQVVNTNHCLIQVQKIALRE